MSAELHQVGALDFDEVAVGLDFEAAGLEASGGLQHRRVAIPGVVEGAADQVGDLGLGADFLAVDVDDQVGFEGLVGESLHDRGVEQAGTTRQQEQDRED